MAPIFSKRFGVGIFMPLLFLLSLLMLTTASCDAGTSSDCSLDTLLVTTTEDISDGVCGAEHCTLREAVQTVNGCNATSLTTIQLGEGTYTLALRGTGDARGDLDISQNTAIVGISPGRTIISGASSWNDRIIHVGVATTARIQDLTVANGNSVDGLGGGIFNEGSLELDNVALENNRGVYGAGLFNANEAMLQSVEIFDNRTPGDQDVYLFTPDNFGFLASCGGGIANNGNIEIRDTLVHENAAVFGSGVCNGQDATLSFDTGFVERNELVEASVDGRKGGGFYNLGTMSLRGLVVRSNTADSGGGIYHESSSGLLALESVFILENETTSARIGDRTENGNGAGLFISGDFQISESQIMDNAAQFIGGGLHISHGSGWIRNTSIGRNSAITGGGIFVGLRRETARSIDFELTNVTISSNYAFTSGGAAYFHSGDATFINTTIAFNENRILDSTASSVGGVDIFGGHITFKNSLLTLNKGDCLLRGGSVSSTGHNIQMNASCPFDDSTDLANVHVAEVILFDLVQINGQWVHVLLPGGPAVDYIDPVLCPEDDQTGQIRPLGDFCDVGAYEISVEAMAAGGTGIPLIPTPTPDGPSTVTIITTTPCYAGPGPQYGQISSLKEGIVTQLIGAGFTGDGNDDWVVTHHPTAANTNCWLDTDNVIPSIPFSEMRLITVPGLPTPTPKPTSDRPPQESTPACYYDANNALICP